MHAQNRAFAFTTALTAPFFVAFLIMPDLVMAALFMRGAFDAGSAAASGAALAAYGVGLPAVVLIRTAISSFHARQDTSTPLIASFAGIGVNLLLKLLLFSSMGAPGLALATAVGAWVNFGLLVLLATRRGWMRPDRALMKTLGAVSAAALALAAVAVIAGPFIGRWASTLPTLRTEAHLAVLGTVGTLAYFGVLFGLLTSLRVPWRRA
jgi:putative peptidoglycan lipid II flippase